MNSSRRLVPQEGFEPPTPSLRTMLGLPTPAEHSRNYLKNNDAVGSRRLRSAAFGKKF
jgi:hypothetical protein